MTADERRKLIEQYLATKRRIGETERKALKKVGAAAEAGAQCSFCGKSQDRVTMLIQGTEGASICSDCVKTVKGLLDEET
jgi:ribosomal protein L37AE/L43A